MSVNSVTTPYPIFTDADGDPLEAGYIYIGEPNLNPISSPKSVFWDSDMAVPASQPIRTIGGYPSNGGTPGILYVQGDYSIAVYNKNEKFIFTSPVGTGVLSSINSYATVGDLIGYTSAPNGTSVMVLGYGAANDGGGGIFNWDDTVDKATANGGTIIDPSVSLALQGTGSGTGCWIRQYEGKISVKWFGATGDGTTDDTTAITNAVSLFNTNRATVQSELWFPGGMYVISNMIDFSHTGGERSTLSGGDDIAMAEIIVNFDGYGATATAEYAFKFGDAADSYQSPIAVNGFQFTMGASATYAPVGIVGILSQSRIKNITFGSWNNTTIRLVSPQNTRHENIVMFSGGLAFTYKDASAVTVQQSGTTLTASGAIFATGDVGKTIAIWSGSPSYDRRKAKITAFTSSTVVTLDTSYTDSVAHSLYFGSPLVSMTSGSPTLTADAGCFTSDMVGLTVLVKGAGTTISSQGQILRAKISAYVSATTVTLDTNAGTTISGEEFTVPAVDIYSKAGAGASDNSFNGLQIENHKGVGLVLMDTDQMSFMATKIHGEQSATASVYSLSNIWMQQTQGYYQGSFDAQYLGEEKVYAVYQTSTFNFENLIVRTANDEKILRVDEQAVGFEGGIVQFDDVSMYGSSTAVLTSLITDNTGFTGYILTGKESRDETAAIKVHLGNAAYGDENGDVYTGKIFGASSFPLLPANPYGSGQTEASIDPLDITWGGTTDPSGTATNQYKWHQFGNMVFFNFRLEYSTAGVDNTGVLISLPSDMPTPDYFSGTADGEIHGPVLGFISASTSTIALCKSYMQRDGSGGFEFVSTLNSGTIAAVMASFQGFYFV